MGQRLNEIGEVNAREQALMMRAVVLRSDVSDFRSERVKAIYLGVCLDIGRLKPQSSLDEIARRGERWWDSLIPDSDPGGLPGIPDADSGDDDGD
ncbi:MAG: hypothetical protein ACLQU1_28475 [Bryobacteraceae bacterium]